MPFRLGKGKKQDDEQPDPTEAEAVAETPEDVQPDPEAAEAQGFEESSPGTEVESPAEPAAEAAPAPAPADAFQFRPSYLGATPAESRVPREFKRARPVEDFEGERSILVLVRNEAGEPVSIDEFQTAKDARAHVELCLETGTSEDRIAVFRASAVPLQVTRRPLVRLVPRDS